MLEDITLITSPTVDNMSVQKKSLMEKYNVEVVKEKPASLISHKMNAAGREDKDDAFYVADLGDIVNKWKLWHQHLPRVEPHYAVKCNDDPAVLSVLSHLGAGFDCASKAEIQRVLSLHVEPGRIVYANPCKQASHIKYAAKHDVALMTFDNETELHKVNAIYPFAKLVLRILPPDDTKCQCQLGMKFGVHPKKALHLLRKAKELDLDVVGVSFHVGSGCYDGTAFSAAVASARTVFDMGKEAGYAFSLLDIGGGFPGQDTAKLSFQEICGSLRPALDMYFPADMGVRLIAEPGRFFVASAFTLAVNIIAKRTIPRDQTTGENEMTADDEPMYMYYVNDGVYGSFNCLLYDHATVEPALIHPELYDGAPRFTCSIWGPTCDGLDCIMKECQMPALEQGDWMQFVDMGAYTMCAASNFNGMPKPRSYYMINEHEWTYLCDVAAEKRPMKKAARRVNHSCSYEAAVISDTTPVQHTILNQD